MLKKILYSGASFILYNSARIETILRKFNEKVEVGYYNMLPELSDINFGLLCEEVKLKGKYC